MQITNIYLPWSKARNLLACFYQDNKGFIWFLMGIFFIRTTFINWNYIPTASMNPNLVEGDYVLVNKMAYDLKLPFIGTNLIAIAQPSRGDIVAFDRGGQLYVKRVLAIPGDRVQITDNSFYINGVQLQLTPTSLDIVTNKQLPYSSKVSFSGYRERNSVIGEETKSYNVIFAGDLPEYIENNLITDSSEFLVPNNNYFMIGDNRNLSHDSRYFGLIKREQIVGSINTILFNYQQIWQKITQQETIDKFRLLQQLTNR